MSLPGVQLSPRKFEAWFQDLIDCSSRSFTELMPLLLLSLIVSLSSLTLIKEIKKLLNF